MVRKSREIVDLDVDELIDDLNKALADEWLAFYQYWVGAKVIEGPMRVIVEPELKEHAEEELEHAEKLADRISQLGGDPLLEPSKWFEETNCGYSAPEDSHVRPILEQNIEGERCAIDTYKELIDKVKGKDEVTRALLLDILKDELEHEEELADFKDDMNMMGYTHGNK
ncbi:MAG: Bacterial ferritin-like protein [Candidatus Methanohalarchaeum thermophilum]|uniref:DNA protection during starvation protein n=1 Tax=Methanohalarchaeum thermophilum TaxID=1903181 RepID=A0A1Q6DTP6_METT1|nr:MAG: Bacterial ferritin-like protein [Candidatus Methanohalarchaeum thermophilum]